ncbi:MAG: hypothetical protein QM723_27445 [Myxococcaceae bacterium]
MGVTLHIAGDEIDEARSKIVMEAKELVASWRRNAPFTRRVRGLLEHLVKDLEIKKAARRAAQTPAEIRAEARLTERLFDAKLRADRREFEERLTGGPIIPGWEPGGVSWREELDRTLRDLRRYGVTRQQLEKRVKTLVEKGEAAWTAFTKAARLQNWMAADEAERIVAAKTKKEDRIRVAEVNRRIESLRKHQPALAKKPIAKKPSESRPRLSPAAKLQADLGELNAIRKESGLRPLSREEYLERRKAFAEGRLP